MTATAAESGYGIETGYAHGPKHYRVAKPPADRRPMPIPEPWLAYVDAQRDGYCWEKLTLRLADKFIVTTIPRSKFYQLIGATTHNRETDAHTPSRTSTEHSPNQILAPNAFIMQMEHLDFLKRVSTGDDAPISSQTASLAMEAWQLIWTASGRKIPVPAACTGPDGQMFYSWDRGRHHLELEIIPGQPAEFFYRDRETEQLWGEEYEVGEPLPSEVVAKLRYFS